jgi:hypothetical protein
MTGDGPSRLLVEVRRDEDKDENSGNDHVHTPFASHRPIAPLFTKGGELNFGEIWTTRDRRQWRLELDCLAELHPATLVRRSGHRTWIHVKGPPPSEAFRNRLDRNTSSIPIALKMRIFKLTGAGSTAASPIPAP